MSLSRVEYLHDVSPEELQYLIRKWFRAATMVIVTRCRIHYSGRASSEAGEASRLVIIKEDGTVLVHEGTGREPINWQPKAQVFVREVEGKTEIVAIRSRPREELRIEVLEPSSVLITRLTTAKFILEKSEKDLVDKIASNPSIIEDGAHLIAREVTTPHGRIDVMLRGRDGKVVVVEVKRSLADVDSVYQLKRYIEYYRSLGIDAKGVIAAPKISPKALKLAQKLKLNYIRIEV